MTTQIQSAVDVLDRMAMILREGSNQLTEILADTAPANIGMAPEAVNSAARTHHPDVLAGEQHVSGAIDFLDDRLDLLVQRLEPVLGPPPSPMVAGIGPTPGEDETAPLASTLHKHGARVNAAGNRVDYLISRLEV